MTKSYRSSNLLLLQFRAIKCVESPLSDCDNHGISEENVEALCNEGLVAIHNTNSIYILRVDFSK
jgi:hypothetical protein